MLHLAITSPKIVDSTIFRFLYKYMFLYKYIPDHYSAVSKNALEPLLHTAIIWKQAEIIEFLLDVVRVDINQVSDAVVIKDILRQRRIRESQILHFLMCEKEFAHTALHLAVALRDIALLKALIIRGGDINFAPHNGPTPLQLAIITDDHGISRYLLDSGADVNGPTYGDQWAVQSTLTLAVYRMKFDFIKDMLAKGAKVNYKPHRACAALPLAVYYNRIEVVDLLLDHGADLNITGFLPHLSMSSTALCHAASKGYLKIAQLLLDRGADVNLTAGSSSRTTALGLAASNRQLDMVQLLINNGADSNLPLNERFVSALELAKRNPRSPNLGVITLFESYREDAMEQWNSLRLLEMD